LTIAINVVDVDLKVLHILSLVGRVFFSAVSVFFSLVLSKVVTPERSALSAISAEALKQIRNLRSALLQYSLIRTHLGM